MSSQRYGSPQYAAETLLNTKRESVGGANGLFFILLAPQLLSLHYIGFTGGFEGLTIEESFLTQGETDTRRDGPTGLQSIPPAGDTADPLSGLRLIRRRLTRSCPEGNISGSHR